MAAWLGTDEGAPEISTIDLVEWVRSLPATKVPEETKKSIARILINDQITGCTFNEIVHGSDRWKEIGVTDKSQQTSIARLFKQKKHEMVMAEAARQEHLAQHAFVNNKKAEMFNA